MRKTGGCAKWLRCSVGSQNTVFQVSSMGFFFFFSLFQHSHRALSLAKFCSEMGMFDKSPYKRSLLNLSNASCQTLVDKVPFYCSFWGSSLGAESSLQCPQESFTFLVISHPLGNFLTHLWNYFYQSYCSCQKWNALTGYNSSSSKV